MAKILITGASGFIGSNLFRALLKSKNEINVWLRDNSDLWRIKDIINNCNCHLVDLTNPQMVKEKINSIKPEIVYHCATYGVSHSQKDLNIMLKTNVVGSLNLFNAISEQNNVRHIVNIGTSLEYGSKSGPINEKDCERPNTPYGISKLSQTQFAQYFAKNYDLPITTLRIFTSYGKFEEPKHLIGDIMLGLITKKPIKIRTFLAKRDFIYIDDVVDAIIKTGESKPFKDIINVGTGKEYSTTEIIEIAKKFGNITVIESDEKDDERTKGEGYSDVDKSRKMLNWKSKYSVQEGLEKTYEWFKQYKKYYLET